MFSRQMKKYPSSTSTSLRKHLQELIVENIHLMATASTSSRESFAGNMLLCQERTICNDSGASDKSCMTESYAFSSVCLEVNDVKQ